jgi:ubiquinone/menaquinone biosynthesis C-methylase UbiE
MANERPAGEGPTPERIIEIAWGYCAPYILSSAVELGLFTRIAEGKNTLPALQESTGASARGLRMLLDALTGMQFLTREGSGDQAVHGLAPDAAQFLVEGKPSYFGGFLRISTGQIAGYWSHLAECVRSGKPVAAVENPEEGAQFWGELVEAIFPLSYPAAARAAEELGRLYPNGPLRLLDVAAGSGVWGIAAAQSDPRIQIVAFDLPTTLPTTRRFVERFGLGDRIQFRPGDIREDDLGNAEFDAALLGHICHSEGVEHSRRLLAKTARALKPGGTVVIADMLPDDDRSGPVFPLLFALNMLVHTTGGDTFSFGQYAAWLKEAGFQNPRLLEGTAPSPLILATRQG